MFLFVQSPRRFGYVGSHLMGKSESFPRVRPIFVEEENEIVVVTIYTYYF